MVNGGGGGVILKNYLIPRGASLRRVLMARVLLAFAVLAVSVVVIFAVGFQWVEQYRVEQMASGLVSASEARAVSALADVERGAAEVASLWAQRDLDPVRYATGSNMNFKPALSPGETLVFLSKDGRTVSCYGQRMGWHGAEASREEFPDLAGGWFSADGGTLSWAMGAMEAGKATWSSLWTGPQGQRRIVFLVPVSRKYGDRIGGVGIVLTEEFLSNVLRESLPSPRSSVVVTAPDGTLVAGGSGSSPSTNFVERNEGGLDRAEFGVGNLARIQAGRRPLLVSTSNGGRLVYVRELLGSGGLHWRYIASVPRMDIAPISKHGIVLPLVVLLLAVVVTAWQVDKVGRELMSPLADLAKSDPGDSEDRPPSRSQSEIREIRVLEDHLYESWARRQECRLLQERVSHLERLQVAGTLVGGVAHDLGNLLMIAEQGQEAAELSKDGDSRKRLLLASQEALQKAGALTRSLVGFCRGVRGDKKLTDLVAVVRRIGPLLTAAVGKKGQLVIDLPDAPVLVLAVPVQLDQVLVNIVINASDAISSGGMVSVGVSRRDDGGAQLRISDDGMGIPPEKVARIFEPFFTTKLGSGGTGLGLAMVRSIAEDHGATIQVETEIGRGTSFLIDFPVPIV